MEPVNPKRTYRSGRRSAQALETRAAVISAARELFVREGWQKATIAAVARQAGVSVETIYAGFGSKLVLLEAVVVATVRGLMPETPLMEQEGRRAILDEPDQRTQIVNFCSDISGILVHVAPLMSVVRAAADSEPALEKLYRNLHRGRTRNIAVLIDALLQHGPLATEREAAIASVSRLASPELFLLITKVDGLSCAQYATWLSGALIAILLPSGSR
jgi:AcrR family transcriptional regulator